MSGIGSVEHPLNHRTTGEKSLSRSVSRQDCGVNAKPCLPHYGDRHYRRRDGECPTREMARSRDAGDADDGLAARPNPA